VPKTSSNRRHPRRSNGKGCIGELTSAARLMWITLCHVPDRARRIPLIRFFMT